MAWSEAKWIVDTTFKEQYPRMYHITDTDNNLSKLVLIDSKTIVVKVSKVKFTEKVELTIRDNNYYKLQQVTQNVNKDTGECIFSNLSLPNMQKVFVTVKLLNTLNNYSVPPETSLFVFPGKTVQKRILFVDNKTGNELNLNFSYFCQNNSFSKNQSSTDTVCFLNNMYLNIFIKGYPPIFVSAENCNSVINGAQLKIRLSKTGYTVGRN